jgi:uncharacterized damage-inducible protein DinB
MEEVQGMGAKYTDQMAMIYEGNDWHASIRDLLRSVTPEQAVWRPEQGGHTICEIVNHLAYSASLAALRLQGEEATWDNEASWVFSPASMTETEWHEAVDRYDAARQALISVLGQLEEDSQDSGNMKLRDLAQQIIHHEAFHGGQISLLRRLQQQEALM